MAHAYKRTLLASLGFADTDKQDPLHDLACEYLCQPEVVKRIVETIWIGIRFDQINEPRARRAKFGEWSKDGPYGHDVRLALGRRPLLEEPVSKGTGNYKTTVGFVDCIPEFQVRFSEMLSTHDGEPERRSNYYTSHYDKTFRFGIEVKAGSVLASELLRQINLYREYQESAHINLEQWVAVLCRPITQDAAEMLENHKIRVFTLGDNFKTWLAQRRESPKFEAIQL